VSEAEAKSASVMTERAVPDICVTTGSELHELPEGNLSDQQSCRPAVTVERSTVVVPPSSVYSQPA